jgi:DNA (cytosine-5)-methyltransferase 1
MPQKKKPKKGDMPKEQSAGKGQAREVWSFFSGAMGLDLGLESVGLHPTVAVELDHDCCNTIRANRPELTVLERSVVDLSATDIWTARGVEPGEVFLMVGGPPCQSFSPGGKRSGLSDPRGNLIYEYMRLIAEVRPRYFVFENVANIITAALRHRPIARRPGKNWNLSAYNDESPDLFDDGMAMAADELSGTAIRQILKDYSKLGYDLTLGVLDAADYGAPQHRLRFVMLGALKGHPVPALPVPTHGEGRPHRFRTVRDAIEDLLERPGAHSVYTPDVERFFRAVPEGGNWRSMPKDMQHLAMGPSFNAGGGKTGFFRRLAWDRPSPTITGRANRKATALCHPVKHRPLSALECARIQGFPDDWEITGSMAAQYLQVGNAVPVALGEAIGSALVSAITEDASRKLHAHASFDVMLAVAQARLKASARNKVARRSSTQISLEEVA